MTIINNYDQFTYTKVNVPITLKICPSDHDGSDYYVDVHCDMYAQECCYIGEQFIEKMQVQRIRNSQVQSEVVEPQWLVELIIRGGKTEEEVIHIVESFCEILSFHFALKDNCIQNSGFIGFTFCHMDIRRSYATDDGIFGDEDSVRSGSVSQQSLTVIQNNIFELPKTTNLQSELLEKLSRAFMTALKSKDMTSRYLLLYYMFEIIYGTDEYQTIKNVYERECVSKGQKKNGATKKSEVLLRYLQERGLFEYDSFGNKVTLTVETLNHIIVTRNDLTHRADMSNVSNIMYHHMIPILQQILALL
ncbi:MAG: hypothetical protein MRZ65_06880 [Lachnospiraceae bacterium]|nr:hypothetical protein [Lachnospiraceae bacterium]